MKINEKNRVFLIDKRIQRFYSTENKTKKRKPNTKFYDKLIRSNLILHFFQYPNNGLTIFLIPVNIGYGNRLEY